MKSSTAARSFIKPRTASLRKSVKLLGAAACCLGVLLALAVLALPLLLNAEFVTRHVQARVAASYGLELEIGGELEADFIPGLRFTLNDLRFARQGDNVATVKQASIGVDLWPLLGRQVRINSIALREPVVHLERYADGSYNVSKPEPRVTLMLASVEVENATFHYDDAVLGTRYEANTCNLVLDGARPLTRDSLDHFVELALAAEFDCAELRKDALALTDVKLSALAQAGVLRFEPVSLRMFGADGSGVAYMDSNGAVPVYGLEYSLPQFRMDDLFRMLLAQTPQEGAIVEEAIVEEIPVEGTPVEGTLVEGLMDFSTVLSTQGRSMAEAQRALSGTMTLRGENLVINGVDLDKKIARFESSQHFNLVDAGAFLFAGPLGLVLTKGYNFANIFGGPGTNSAIRSLVSDWNVTAGVAEAEYVMMTTDENRLALKGSLDLANKQYQNVTIALLDDAGCVRIEQALQGSFQDPVFEKPNVLRSLAGPVRALLNKLVPRDACAPFYPVAEESPPL